MRFDAAQQSLPSCLTSNLPRRWWSVTSPESSQTCYFLPNTWSTLANLLGRRAARESKLSPAYSVPLPPINASMDSCAISTTKGKSRSVSTTTTGPSLRSPMKHFRTSLNATTYSRGLNYTPARSISLQWISILRREKLRFHINQ